MDFFNNITYNKRKIGDEYMPDRIQNILELYKTEINRIAESHIVKIILYGSYARGDFNQYSDIDIMILVNNKETEISDYEEKIYDLTYDFNCKYDTEIMPIIKNVDQFEYWKKAYMFYKNVDEEGVLI